MTNEKLSYEVNYA